MLVNKPAEYMTIAELNNLISDKYEFLEHELKVYKERYLYSESLLDNYRLKCSEYEALHKATFSNGIKGDKPFGIIVDWDKAPESTTSILINKDITDSHKYPYYWVNDKGEVFVNGLWVNVSIVNLYLYTHIYRGRNNESVVI